MRFPFFATYRQLDWQGKYEINARLRLEQALDNLKCEQADQRQKVLVLEGRINKLEEAKKHGRKKRK